MSGAQREKELALSNYPHWPKRHHTPLRLSPLAVALAATLAIGCAEDDERAFEYTITPGACGLNDYRWLGPDQVGAALSSEEDVFSPLSRDQIEAIIRELAAEYLPEPSPLRFGARVLRMRYTTQDRGQPVEATGMVGIPWSEQALDRPFPTVLLLHGTTGFSGPCAPSRLGVEHAALVYVLTALGYVVAAPDYIGLDAAASASDPDPVRHAYLNIEQTAIGSIDALRAAKGLLAQLPNNRVRATDEVVLWGGSQGGHAAFAVDRLAPFYAPELLIRASVAMVPPTDMYGLAQYAVSAMNDATLTMPAFLVAQHLWYRGRRPFTDILTDVEPHFFAGQVPLAMYSTCDPGELLDDLPAIDEIFNPALLDRTRRGDWDALEPWSCYTREASMATSSVPLVNRTPTLFILGEQDTLVYTPVQREDFDRLCELGYQLDYLECADAGHTQAAAWSAPQQIAWVEERMAGEPIDPARVCQRSAPVRCSGQSAEGSE